MNKELYFKVAVICGAIAFIFFTLWCVLIRDYGAPAFWSGVWMLGFIGGLIFCGSSIYWYKNS